MSYQECFDKLSGILQIEKGLANCGGSESFYYDTLKSITEYVPKKIEHLKECLSQKDYEGYIIEVHTLKSNAAVIGAETLMQEAKRLEYAGKEKQYPVIETDTTQLIMQYEQMLAQIKSVLQAVIIVKTKSPDEFATEEDKLQCYDIVCEAEDCIKDEQYEDAMEELELLEIYEVPVKLRERITSVYKRLEEEEYDLAYEELKELKEQI